MMFKNPYKNDAANYMNSHEKLFLKKALFELAAQLRDRIKELEGGNENE